jgi:hypothetical protein
LPQGAGEPALTVLLMILSGGQVFKGAVTGVLVTSCKGKPMKKIIFALTAAATLMVPMAASAQAWRSINQRQTNLYNRIEQGVRNGSLTRPEARRLQNRFTTIARLENRYRANGLSMSERRDLDQRFDSLSRQIRMERHDRQDRRYR